MNLKQSTQTRTADCGDGCVVGVGDANSVADDESDIDNDDDDDDKSSFDAPIEFIVDDVVVVDNGGAKTSAINNACARLCITAMCV